MVTAIGSLKAKARDSPCITTTGFLKVTATGSRGSERKRPNSTIVAATVAVSEGGAATAIGSPIVTATAADSNSPSMRLNQRLTALRRLK